MNCCVMQFLSQKFALLFQLRRYEFIRRSLTRTEKPSSPTFVIEGRKVTHKATNGESILPESESSFDDSKLDFDPIAFLEGKMAPLKSLKMPSTTKNKTEGVQPAKGTATSVILPVLHIEGPGFAHQQRSKSSSLPGDDQPAEVEDMATEPPAVTESIWSELENLDQKYHRSIKKNNFFLPAGTRLGEEHPDLRVENSHKSKTITLQLQTNGSTTSRSLPPRLPPAPLYNPPRHSHRPRQLTWDINLPNTLMTNSIARQLAYHLRLSKCQGRCSTMSMHI
ncbi:hypothetical protein EB796_018485 [Bugula neritina]|uniref:Uncharacterized protein n=1 Tax=Bugula neritina TaxID=10212 RepID=A0A7J7JC65_BUGNE|nr:hypothetical protein EB796_018485 [Bugula neritina]